MLTPNNTTLDQLQIYNEGNLIFKIKKKWL